MLFNGIDINSTDGTFLVAFTATDTLIIINGSTEVFYSYRLHGTRLNALHTAYTARFTLLTCLGSLIVITA